MATLTDLANKIKDLPIHSVGEEWHSFTGQIPVGGVPYCGQGVSRETYADLWTWVQNQGLVKTDTEWLALNTSQNGNVPFYSSGNGSTTFRMPRVVGYIKGAASQSEAGTYTSEGLPNATGQAGLTTGYGLLNNNAGNNFSGALLKGTQQSKGVAGTTMSTATNLALDLSKSNPIFGNSAHVTPETSVILFGVYALG